MPTLDLVMTYTFGYLVNEESATDRKKRDELNKTCATRHLDKMFANLPDFFHKALEITRDYFPVRSGVNVEPVIGYNIPATVENEEMPRYIVKAIFSCFAEHFCSVVFPKSASVPEVGFRGDDQNYGMDTNIQDALAQMDLGTASGQWLDMWGTFFLNFKRSESETDDSVRNRIISSLRQPKTTIDVITDTIANYINEDDFTVYELVDVGIHNSPDSPSAPAPLNDDFNHNSVKDRMRRQSRIVVELKALEPFDGAMWVATPTDVGAPVQEDESFIMDDTGFTPGTAEREESYLHNTLQLPEGVSLPSLVLAVEAVKAAGVRMYYRIGTDYVVV